MELSFMEMVVIGVIAFLVFGPEELIRKANQFGRFMGKLKTQANNFRIMAEEEILRKDMLKDLADSKAKITEALTIETTATPVNNGLESEIEKNILEIRKPK